MIQVARGRLRKQIAHDIGIAEATVKVHRMRAVQKMTDALSRVRPVGRQAQAAARNAATLVSTTPCATRCSRGDQRTRRPWPRGTRHAPRLVNFGLGNATTSVISSTRVQ